jgi:hypothetical protein
MPGAIKAGNDAGGPMKSKRIEQALSFFDLRLDVRPAYNGPARNCRTGC